MLPCRRSAGAQHAGLLGQGAGSTFGGAPSTATHKSGLPAGRAAGLRSCTPIGFQVFPHPGPPDVARRHRKDPNSAEKQGTGSNASPRPSPPLPPTVPAWLQLFGHPRGRTLSFARGCSQARLRRQAFVAGSLSPGQTVPQRPPPPHRCCQHRHSSVPSGRHGCRRPRCGHLCRHRPIDCGTSF